MNAVSYVNHGRWVADCPCVGCHSAQVVQPGMMFWCPECQMAGNGNTAAEITWPADDDKAAIVGVLWARPEMENRNWYPWETLDSLRADNVAHGIGVS